MGFNQLMLEEDLIRSANEMGLNEPTYIQKKAIPEIKKGQDVIGQSETGSGKTAAFALPLIEKTVKGEGIQVLVLTPTRELAEQVADQFFRFSKYRKIKVLAVYGGVSIDPQIRFLKNAEIVVATPGRLLDHIQRNTILLSKIRFLVLDEADKMFEMGFIDDVKRIISRLPVERQTLLFSATINQEIRDLSRNYMKQPTMVKGELHVDKMFLEQKYYDVNPRDKFSLLLHLVNQERPKLAMVFCATRHKADAVARNLQKNRIDAVAIHGGHTQNRRSSVIRDFHTGKIHILVATDVAARGLDIKNVSHIFNYDLPKTSQEYTHRIGRTARAGKKGIAISLLSDIDHDNFRRILEDRTLKIANEGTPQFQKVPFLIKTRNEFRKPPFRRRF
ncbi:DEAD/DEAH box helicase [Candidatus Woesearchaeota archaeon]|nr:DEAD/DEAH box helicase [Candidatus Woesearchaeota archaeon]